MADKIITPKIKELDFRAREAINALRGNIQMAGYNVRTIAVTSSRANEGKSSLAFRLAKSLGGLRKKTLYLDCDIRNSKVKRRYHILEKTKGLSEYLCGNAEQQEIIYHTDDPYFDLIFSGASAPNPSELLSSDLFENLLKALKEEYDFVVVDTPPVNVVIDAALIAPKCDTTILVVESRFTNKKDAYRAKMQLEYSRAKILGIVLNKVQEGSGYSRYGYGKYGYGKYGYGKSDSQAYGYGKERKESDQ